MTREQMINEAVAKAVRLLEEDGLKPYINFHCDRNLIADHIFPEIEKRGLWNEIWEYLPDGGIFPIESNAFAEGARVLALATPLQICEAFLRATGAWTEEMEAAK